MNTLSPSDVLRIGLVLLKIFSRRNTSEATKVWEFKRQYGSSPVVLSLMWHDLKPTLEEKEQSEKGFKMFMVAHYFLWTYPKNSSQISQSFPICERYCRGEPLWHWVGAIASLRKKKIVWQESLDDPNTEIFVVTVDGTDCKIWEKKHPLLNKNSKLCSHKFKSAGLKYEIALSVYDSKCVWIAGPFRCGKGDLAVFQGKEDKHDKKLRKELGRPRYEGLQNKIAPGKLAIVDRGYGGAENIAPPSSLDPDDLHNFKARGRCRHETFNSHIKFYQILQNCFRHGVKKHPIAFDAVCVTVQYQMDDGAELFAV